MDELLWRNAIPDRVMDAVMQRIESRRNRNAVIDLLRWIVAKDLHWRTEKGFHLVRGSDPGMRDGLKTDPFLQSLGLTEGKIRGAINTMRETEILADIEQNHPKSPKRGLIVRWNFRRQKRNPPCLYRLGSWLQDLLRLELRGNSRSHHPVASSAKKKVSRNSSRIQNNNLFTGKLSSALLPGLANVFGRLSGRSASLPTQGPMPSQINAGRQSRVAAWRRDWDHCVSINERDNPRLYGVGKWGRSCLTQEALDWLAEHARRSMFDIITVDGTNRLIGFKDPRVMVAFKMMWCGR